MSQDILFWCLAGLATFVVGASKGGLPGVGILGVPILSQVISPVVAAGLLLPLYVISDWYGLWLYRKNYDSWNIKLMTLSACIGIGIGWGQLGTKTTPLRMTIGHHEVGSTVMDPDRAVNSEGSARSSIYRASPSHVGAGECTIGAGQQRILESPP